MSAVFPQAVITDQYIFLSGTPGIDPVSGKITSDDFEAQARQCFANIKMILEEAGSELSKVVKTTVFMVAGNDFSILNNVYSAYFPENPPARSTIAAAGLPKGALVEIEIVAMLQPRAAID